MTTQLSPDPMEACEGFVSRAIAGGELRCPAY